MLLYVPMPLWIITYLGISILSTFYRIFVIIVHEHNSYHLKFKFNSRLHGSIKPKSTVTNFIACLDFITPLVYSQRQVGAIYFDFSNPVYIVSHALLLPKLDDFGLSPAYLALFYSYLTSRLSDVRYRETLRHPTKCYPVRHKDQFWEHLLSVFL